MNKKFNFIINLLIIILIIALVVVMMDYYANTESIPTLEKEFINNQEVILPSGDDEKNNTIIKIENSGESNIEIFVESGELNNIVIESGEVSGDITKETTEVRPEKKNESPVIMSSENEISSKEKGEILTELDKTLMELLDVVDRVQVVDETRLITDDSEVQK